MADAVADGIVDAFWVGEPWGSVAVQKEVGQLMMAGRDVWQFAPEKVLAARHDWIERNPDLVSSLMRAVYQAAAWLDTPKNLPLAVEILSRSEHLSLSTDLIDPAVSGDLVTKIGARPVAVERFVQFHKHAATFPWRSQAAWIAQHLGADARGIETAKPAFGPTSIVHSYLAQGDMRGASRKVEGALRLKQPLRRQAAYDSCVVPSLMAGPLILAQNAY